MRQLADFESKMAEFRKENVGVIALSVDPLDKAGETVEKLRLTFPVAYGLEVPRDAEKVSAFWEERRSHHRRRCLEPYSILQEEESSAEVSEPRSGLAGLCHRASSQLGKFSPLNGIFTAIPRHGSPPARPAAPMARYSERTMPQRALKVTTRQSQTTKLRAYNPTACETRRDRRS